MSKPNFLDYRKLPTLPTVRPVTCMYASPHNGGRVFALPYNVDTVGEVYLSLEHFVAMLHNQTARRAAVYGNKGWRGIVVSPSQVHLGIKHEAFKECQFEVLKRGGRVMMSKSAPYALAFPLSKIYDLSAAMLPALQKQARQSAGDTNSNVYNSACDRLSAIIQDHGIDITAAIAESRRKSTVTEGSLLAYEPCAISSIGVHTPSAYYGRPYSLHAVKTNQLGSYCTWLA